MILGIIFTIAGSLVLFGAAKHIYNQTILYRIGKKSTGRVVAIIYRKRLYTDQNRPGFPVVEFTTQTGQKIKFTNNVYIGSKIGDNVPVIYTPSEPENALIDTGWKRWFSYLALLIIGIIFLTIGFLEVTGRI